MHKKIVFQNNFVKTVVVALLSCLVLLCVKVSSFYVRGNSIGFQGYDLQESYTLNDSVSLETLTYSDGGIAYPATAKIIFPNGNEAYRLTNNLIKLSSVGKYTVELSAEIKGFPEGNIKKEKFFPYETLKGFLAKIEEAYKTIEKYKGIDDEYYQKLYDRICMESMSYRMLMIILYENNF